MDQKSYTVTLITPIMTSELRREDEAFKAIYTAENGEPRWDLIRSFMADQTAEIERLATHKRNSRRSMRNMQAAYERQRGLALSYKTQLDEQDDQYVPGIFVGVFITIVSALIAAALFGVPR